MTAAIDLWPLERKPVYADLATLGLFFAAPAAAAAIHGRRRRRPRHPTGRGVSRPIGSAALVRATRRPPRPAGRPVAAGDRHGMPALSLRRRRPGALDAAAPPFRPPGDQTARTSRLGGRPGRSLPPLDPG